jgi:hypothetical protein
MVILMVMEFKLIVMDIVIKVNGKMILNKEKEFISLMILLFTMEFSKTTKILKQEYSLVLLKVRMKNVKIKNNINIF